MKPVKPSRGLLRNIANDPHGDTVVLQMNPPEAVAATGLLKSMGGAGVRNPRTGWLQFYSDSSHEHGAAVDHDRPGPVGGGGNQGGGNGGAGPQMSSDALRGWGAGGTGAQISHAAAGSFDAGIHSPNPHESFGYTSGQAPSFGQSAARFGLGLLGATYNPNSINVQHPMAGTQESYDSGSIDPVAMGLAAAGMMSPIGTIAGLGYKVANMAGIYGPQIGFTNAPTVGGASQPGTQMAGHTGMDNGSDPLQAALGQNLQQQQGALAAASGQAGSIPTMGLLNGYQRPYSGQTAPGYGYQVPGYGYLRWGAS
jgi:hypothetical protein